LLKKPEETAVLPASRQTRSQNLPFAGTQLKLCENAGFAVELIKDETKIIMKKVIDIIPAR
jgi:hypothetical protein